jgi:signal transduction histidine kinase
VPVAAFLSEIGVVANLHAESRALQFTLEPVNPELAVNADPQLFASAVTNLLNNAFKYKRAGGRVVLRALCDDGRVRIEVEDECGGIPDTTVDPFKAFADRRRNDRTGLGLGLSIARKAVRMHGGDIAFRNLPGKGCVFVIEMPLAVEGTPVLDAPV